VPIIVLHVEEELPESVLFTKEIGHSNQREFFPGAPTTLNKQKQQHAS